VAARQNKFGSVIPAEVPSKKLFGHGVEGSFVFRGKATQKIPRLASQSAAHSE
jgi:hypothetical protein